MDLFSAIKGRRSCRKFLQDPIGEETIEQILEAAIWAPSPVNNQPWEFIVITNADIKKRIHEESVQFKQVLVEKSGWKWLGVYKPGFLMEAPVIIAVVGDPNKGGADMFVEGEGTSYMKACSAAIQNMLLAAHALGLGSLWFTLYDKDPLRKILNIGLDKDPAGLIIIGKAAGAPLQTPRKEIKEKTRYLR